MTFPQFLDLHAKAFLSLRLERVGFHAAIEEFKERFIASNPCPLLNREKESAKNEP